MLINQEKEDNDTEEYNIHEKNKSKKMISTKHEIMANAL